MGKKRLVLIVIILFVGTFSQVGSAAAKQNLAAYDGPIEHIFFHTLIAYPTRAFDGDSMSKGMDDYFVTVKEFRAVLKETYKRGYILVDYNDFYKKVNGKLVRQYPLLPAGKKPLVLSIDDMNYYASKQKHGTVNRLILDKKGNVAAESTNLKGKKIVSRNTDIVPILDDFVKKHPDYSYKGKKGMIAPTGYAGVLGYRTQAGSKNRASEIKRVKPIIKRLKETGWYFASHSYAHPSFLKSSKVKITCDTKKWKKEVEPLVGKTNLFVYPYGSRIPQKDARLNILKKAGFNVFCGVGAYHSEYLFEGCLQTKRANIDGILLRGPKEYTMRFFDKNKVIDWAARTKKRGGYKR